MRGRWIGSIEGGVIGQTLGGQIGSMSNVLLQTACTSPLIQTQRQAAIATLEANNPRNAIPTSNFFFMVNPIELT